MIPVTAVLRINGQFFAFVAEDGRRQAGRAKQRAIKVGPIVGDNYPVLDGIKPGERVVVVGRAEARRRRADRSGAAPAVQPQRQSVLPSLSPKPCHRVRRHLHPSSDSGERLLAGDHPRGRDRDPDAADRAVPGARAAAGAGRPRSTTAPARETVETAVTTPLEQAINGVEGMQYMTSSSGNDGTCGDHGHVRHHAQPRRRRRRRAEPHLAGRRPAAERSEAGRHLGDEGRRTTSCSPPACTPRTASTTRCSSATTSIASSRTRSSACPASAT